VLVANLAQRPAAFSAALLTESTCCPEAGKALLMVAGTVAPTLLSDTQALAEMGALALRALRLKSRPSVAAGRAALKRAASATGSSWPPLLSTELPELTALSSTSVTGLPSTRALTLEPPLLRTSTEQLTALLPSAALAALGARVA
jgi:hypothetical protein